MRIFERLRERTRPEVPEPDVHGAVREKTGDEHTTQTRSHKDSWAPLSRRSSAIDFPRTH